MKRLFNYIIIFVLSFIFAALRAGAIPEACDSKINTETYYNESGWDTYVYVCNSQFTGRYAFSTCDEDRQAAKDYCEGTYSQSQYKGSYQTAETGECSEEKIESCFKCTVECYKPNGNYYECTASDSYSYTTGTGANKKYYCPSYSWQAAEPITYSNDTDPLGPEDKGTYVEKVKNDKCGSYQSRNAKCEDQYRAKVPIYRCVNPPKKYHVKNMREAKYTVKTKYGTTIPAYCINPDDNAPETLTGNNSMSYDIDATACASSFATTDCGYANILIEGYYRGTLKGNSNYTYAVIGDAMRLWGAHWGAGGYADTGIADEDDTTISDPNKWLKFVPKEDGTYLNVFKETVSAVMEQELYRPSTDDIYDVKTDFDANMNLSQIACSSSRMGLFCGQGGSQKGYLYAIALYVNTVQGNKYMQQHLNEINAHLYGDDIFINNNPEGAVVDIVDERTVRITYPLKEGVEISCDMLDESTANDAGCEMEQKIVIKTATGQIVEEFDSYDFCDKNYCYVDIEVVPGKVTCDVLEGVDIKVKRIKKCGSDSVKKYVSCGSTDDQIMFSFEPDPNCGDEPTFERVPWVDINCNGCPDEPSATTPNCDLEDTSGDYVSREVSDPSLNCILHKNLASANSTNSSRRAYYDYSEMFGVNTNFCKVYCSDKVTYYMEGRKDVYNALQLKYDIESKVFPSRPESEKSSHALTSIIKVQRDCVSEIYYDKINFSVMDQVGKDYGLSGDVTDWKQLYQLLKEKSSSENNRKEVLNQLIYDLYACNFYSDSQISSKTNNKIKKPKDSKNPLSIANTILTNTKNYCNNNDCVTGKIKYEGGAEYISSSDPRYTGLNWVDPALSTEESVYNGLNLRYCSEGSCFRGAVNGSYKEDYSAAGSSKFGDTVNFGGSNISVPTNDYAIFTYTVEADLYNSTRYQVEPYSGKVKVVEGNTFDDTLQTLNKYLYPVNKSVNGICDKYGNDKYMCDVNYDISVPIITRYNSLLNAEKDQIGTIAFRRNFNSYNDLISKLQSTSSRIYSCAYVVKTDGEADKGFVFRNIDLNNPVPVERDGTKLDNSNWDVNNPNDPEYSTFISGVINEIKTSGQEELYATDEYLEYSYELTPDAIRSIRSHNTNTEYFEDVIPGSCTMSDGKNFNCRSSFLEDLHAGRFGVTLKKTDGKSKYNVCKDNPSEEGCIE